MSSYSKFFKSDSGKIVSLTVLLFASLLLYYFYATSHNGGAVPPSTEKVVAMTQDDHIRGAKGASVSIVEYGDFQCPACRAYEAITRDLLTKYPHDVSITFRQFPLINIHKNAYLAASYAEAAGLQGKFWEMHDMLYDKQEEWGESLEAETKIKAYAETLGLNVKDLEVAAKSEAIQKKIVASYKEANDLKLPGTPSFFVNGKKIESKDLASTVEAAIPGAKK